MSRYTELMQQIAELQAEAERVRREETAGTIAEIKATMAQYGLTVDDLRAKRGPRKKSAD